MLTQDRHTTSLMEVRRFLAAEKAAPPPWAEPRTALESLYELLAARRGDALFWSRLSDLVVRLEDHRVNLSRLGHSEAFGYATIDRLLADLRADLQSASGPAVASWRQALSGPLRATSLAAFLLLGTAAASCDEGDADADASLCDEAIDEGLSGEDGQTYCDLVDVVSGSGLSGSQRAALLDCLSSLDAAYRENLLSAFESMSDEEISAHLQQMLDSGGVCYEDTDEGGH